MSTVAAPAIRELITDDDLRLAWPVLRQLRTRLDEGHFLDAVALQRAEGYRVAALFEDGVARVVAGFRVAHMLAHGRHLYVDDLVTDETHRGSGAGRRLFEWLVTEAIRLHCAQLHLDSGVQRFAAHAFYCGRGMRISSHHFALDFVAS
jgi:GNAT superfamily N-acetyltransferase